MLPLHHFLVYGLNSPQMEEKGGTRITFVRAADGRHCIVAVMPLGVMDVSPRRSDSGHRYSTAASKASLTSPNLFHEMRSRAQLDEFSGCRSQ